MTTNILASRETKSPESPQQVYQNLRRALHQKKGFGLFFVVQPDYTQQTKTIQQLSQDLSNQKIEIVQLHTETETLDHTITQLQATKTLDILIIQGLEKPVYNYEETQRLAGWSDEEIYTYRAKSAPPILSHLNQQRERIAQNFPYSFVFLIPNFVIDYFVQKAPDFFESRSSLFKFPPTELELQLRTTSFLKESDFEQYCQLTPDQKITRIAEISHLPPQIRNEPKKKCKLLLEAGFLWITNQEFLTALISFKKALQFNPYDYQIWFNQGMILFVLDRYEEALASFKEALTLNENDYLVWLMQGKTLIKLGSEEEDSDNSISKAWLIYLDNYVNNNSLENLDIAKKYEQAVGSFNQLLTPNFDPKSQIKITLSKPPFSIPNAWNTLRDLAGSINADSDWSTEHNHYLYNTPKTNQINE